MVKDIVAFGTRLPGLLKAKLDKEAKNNHRSVNAEIVARLDESFKPSARSLMLYDSADLVGELMRRYPPGEIMIRIGTERDRGD